MWNSFQDDRDSGLFWLLSESIERLNKEYVESFFRDYREYIFWKVKRDCKERVKNFQEYLDFEQSTYKEILIIESFLINNRKNFEEL